MCKIRELCQLISFLIHTFSKMHWQIQSNVPDLALVCKLCWRRSIILSHLNMSTDFAFLYLNINCSDSFFPVQNYISEHFLETLVFLFCFLIKNNFTCYFHMWRYTMKFPEFEARWTTIGPISFCNVCCEE